MFPIIAGLVGTVISSVTDHFKSKQEMKKAEQDAKVKILEAKTEANIQRMLTQQEGDIAWENTQISNAGWKDEYWTLVLSIPAIMCFIPDATPYVKAGFSALNETPVFYQYFMGGAIGAAFGVKKFTDIMSLKKGV